MKFKNKNFSVILITSLLHIFSEAQDVSTGSNETEKTVSSFDELIKNTTEASSYPEALTLKFSNDITSNERFFAPKNPSSSEQTGSKNAFSSLEENGSTTTQPPFPGIISTSSSLTLNGANHLFKISSFKLEDNANEKKGISLISSQKLTLTKFSLLQINSSRILTKELYGGTVTSSSQPSSFSENTTNSNVPFSLLVGSDVTISENGSVIFFGNSNNQIRQQNGADLASNIPSVIKAVPKTPVVGTLQTSKTELTSEEEASPGTGRLTISDNSSVLVRNNSSATTGGAFASVTMDISKNGSLRFYNNSAKKSGGALATLVNTASQEEPESLQSLSSPSQTQPSPNTISLSQNGDILFYGNMAKSGGAISAQEGCSIDNNGHVLFNNNLANSGGSAIHVSSGKAAQTLSEKAPQLILKENRSVIFSKNTCIEDGGAIFADSGTKISLFADAGDIIFFGNTFQKTPGGRCAIFLEQTSSSATIETLCASDSKTIAFFDPIKCSTLNTTNGESTAAAEFSLNAVLLEEEEEKTPASTPLYINKNPTGTGDSPSVLQNQENTSYTGTVLFSLGHPYGSSTDGSNQTTEVKQPVTLGAGTLIIDRDTTFKCQSFTQENGSTLQLGSGSKLETTGMTSTAAEKNSVENLKNIKIDLNSFDHIPLSTTESYEKTISIVLKSDQQASAPNTTSLKISCTSPEYFAAYNNFDLETPVTFPILSISSDAATAANTLSETSLPEPTTINPSTGYSGTLTFNWKNGAEEKNANGEKILNATWIPTGYKASEKFQSPTFFDVSWIGTSVAKAVSDSTLSKIVCPSDKIFLSSSGEGLFTSLKIGKKNAQSQYEGKGFEINMALGNLSSSSLEIRLARIFGDASNAYFEEDIDTNAYVAGFSIQKISPSKRIGEVFTEASIYYAFSENKLYSSQSDFNPRKLEFESHSFVSAITISGPFLGVPVTPHFFSATPFLKTEFALSKIPSCMEKENISSSLLSRSAIVNVSDSIRLPMTLLETRLRKYSGASLYNLSVLTGVSLKASPQRLKTPFSLAASVAFAGDPYRHYPSGTFIIPQNNIPVFVNGSRFARCSCEVSSVVGIDFLKNLSVYADYKGRFASRNYFYSVKAGSSFHF
ncbi:polymorphic outer membrane protein middle domain-containing protein [Chlamydiifrater phoenicopteri]|uniref:polymorphic outer membrane protein middle domain-containing protein n=1 Tax=Chlamydiifrater phoenicopteri TaxID=2681469 RepID=UPI001BCF0465|nr:polymorphic outer membrane protein middle domain-containing protein [Chlamydiifrater phoenicopteri]